MEYVQLVHRKYIDVGFDEFLRQEVAAHIQMHPTPCESGVIFDLNTGDSPPCRSDAL